MHLFQKKISEFTRQSIFFFRLFWNVRESLQDGGAANI